ncbi:hypothetical protein [Actinotalea sp. JY-7885]|uniref:hypothetical protein n=1 Tax=Actinotalea sp. JY-7885 TaxID=2758576 RepID=UPI00165E185B|nr:hypothetical protein [Actinotalea sp. JY-7885]
MSTTAPPSPLTDAGASARTALGHVNGALERVDRAETTSVELALVDVVAAEEALVAARRALVVALRTGVDERDAHDRRVEIVRPHGWAELADLLGVTRQAAAKTYTPAVAERADRVPARVQRVRYR